MTTVTSMTLCPACGAARDAATDPTNPDQVAPRPGDFSICIACAALQVFDTGLTLRLPTTLETAEAQALPGVQRLQRAARTLRDLRARHPGPSATTALTSLARQCTVTSSPTHPR